MDLSQSFQEIYKRVNRANDRYGSLASTHEGIGVALEEWDELRDAVKANDFNLIYDECLDLAAVLIRMAEEVINNNTTKNRSTK